MREGGLHRCVAQGALAYVLIVPFESGVAHMTTGSCPVVVWLLRCGFSGVNAQLSLTQANRVQLYYSSSNCSTPARSHRRKWAGVPDSCYKVR
jgi:hypothetical protein